MQKIKLKIYSLHVFYIQSIIDFESEQLDTYDIVFALLNTIFKCQMKSNV